MINTPGAIAAIRAFKEATKNNTVTPEVLKARLKVCNMCPRKRSNKGIVGRVTERLSQLAIRHKVPNEIAGFKCGVCGCPLSLLAVSLPENLHKDSVEEAAKRPAFCWLTAEMKKD